MRIWKGIDEEHNGNFGVMTLFIESVNPDIAVVESVLEENKDVRALYFGAGEIDVQQFEFLPKLKRLKEQVGMKIILECSYENIVSKNVRLYFDQIVLRLHIPQIVGTERIKVRTDNFVYIYPLPQFSVNSTIMLRNGQYFEDVELYNKE